MGTSSLERVVMASLGVALVISLGCDITPFPTTPTPTATATPVPEPSAPQRLAALALFDAANVHLVATTSPLTMATDYGKVIWPNGPCEFGQGSMQSSLDGGLAPTPGTFLPTGSHTYVVSFSNCLNWGWERFELTGITSAAYKVADWSIITAMVSAESVRGQGLNVFSELYDVTADGSAAWTRSSNGMTYTPVTGSRLVNNLTTNVATFGGGSYSTISSLQGAGSRMEWRFDNLKVAVNGTEYTLNGSYDVIQPGGSTTYTGEIRIISNGTLVARIYGGGGVNARRVEVLVPLVPL